MKRLVLLGASGSIGQNALDVISRHRDQFSLAAMSVHRRVDILAGKIQEFRPAAVAITGEPVDRDAVRLIRETGVRVYLGPEGLLEMLRETDFDLALNAIVGAAGLMPTVECIRKGRNVALANKESLVMAGEIVTRLADQQGVTIVPVDSEHSAVFQCLMGERIENVQRIILTGSGGPFLHRREHLSDVTVEEALAHPKWRMGKKITIDSATYMNKGLEIIEAHWLFRVPLEKIDVVIHPQSIIHSLVEFVDGSVKAQLGWPDMRVPIQFALTYPERTALATRPLDFAALRELTFFRPDEERFPALRYAKEALSRGGTAPAVLNAANEVAVQFFLEKRITFTQIPELVGKALQEHTAVPHPTLDDILAADAWARQFVKQALKAE
ncbi:MAG TPA: 1-deoxy-D-xylulose-5-phosphate reductoisomerase [Bacteroidetes bacterium]|nr:1-deoxy-D-xylulose-5-phosphate reductoisomerase [Bacteroidota bacterium]